jgi:SAM-dependent methyltransferase
LRFDQLLRVADRETGRFSLNDFGCGYGALVPYLQRRGLDVAFRGFDLSASMLEHARREYPDVTFVGTEGELERADYTVASGIFNVRAGAPEDAWSAHIADTLERMSAVSRRGIAFNVLTSYSDPERMEERLHYADPCRWFDWCKRTLSRQVALLHDYGLYEFTILVRLDQGGST